MFLAADSGPDISILISQTHKHIPGSPCSSSESGRAGPEHHRERERARGAAGKGQEQEARARRDVSRLEMLTGLLSGCSGEPSTEPAPLPSQPLS